jgi:glucose-6-phosphate dehydrogenase assembly protein OpcA
MATTFKVLGQSNPAATTLTTLYTVPASTTAIVSTISVANQSATASSFRIAIRPAGAAIDPKHYLTYDTAILGNQTLPITIGLTLGAGDVISVYAPSTSFSFHAYGQENS